MRHLLDLSITLKLTGPFPSEVVITLFMELAFLPPERTPSYLVTRDSD
jgi:hypothetical protein